MSDEDKLDIIINRSQSMDDLIENYGNESKNIVSFLKQKLGLKNRLAKEFVAELFGTFILVIFTLGSSAQFKFSSKDNQYFTNNLSANLVSGIGPTIAIILVGKVSGAHLNPAVSLAMLITNRLTFLKFFVYSLAQFVGAFIASMVTYLVYLDILNSYKENKYSLDTASIFATYPNKDLSNLGALFDQVVGTGLLVMVILAIGDKKNSKLSHEGSAILIGLTIFIIGSAFGYNSGSPINPARDFSPRLFTLLFGWGFKTFENANYYFWIPIVGPMLGSLVGTLIYLVSISINLD